MSLFFVFFSFCFFYGAVTGRLNLSNLTTTTWVLLTGFSCPQVRLELQSCMSRQQEALRCREVCLLSQIELLEQVKTETLQQQLQQLHWVSLRSNQSEHSTAQPPMRQAHPIYPHPCVFQLRGQFDVICHQLQNSNSSNDLNNQLTCCMEK